MNTWNISCLPNSHIFFSVFNAYITPPIVYITPPKTNHTNPATGKTFDIGYIATIANQPIPIYIALLNHLGQVTQHNLNPIPITEHIVTAKNKFVPIFPCNATKQNGAYDPVIKINIIEWSNLFSIFITLSLAFTQWYVVDALYNKIILTPKNNTDPNVIAELSVIYALTNIAIKANNDNTAPIQWVNPLIGSLKYFSILLPPI